MKFRDLIKGLEADGWRHVRTTGSHLHYRHPSKPGMVTVPGGGKLIGTSHRARYVRSCGKRDLTKRGKSRITPS